MYSQIERCALHVHHVPGILHLARRPALANPIQLREDGILGTQEHHRHPPDVQGRTAGGLLQAPEPVLPEHDIAPPARIQVDGIAHRTPLEGVTHRDPVEIPRILGKRADQIVELRLLGPDHDIKIARGPGQPQAWNSRTTR